MTDHTEHLARVYSERHYNLYSALEASLNPRSPALLHETAAGYFEPGNRILDIGCRDAQHLIGRGCPRLTSERARPRLHQLRD
jgi:hypothetical protein